MSVGALFYQFDPTTGPLQGGQTQIDAGVVWFEYVLDGDVAPDSIELAFYVGHMEYREGLFTCDHPGCLGMYSLLSLFVSVRGALEDVLCATGCGLYLSRGGRFY